MPQPIVEPNFEGEEMKLPSDMQTPVEPERPAGIINAPIIILLFAILIALLGGIYYWYTILMSTPVVPPAPTRPTAEENSEPESTTAEARTGATDVVSTSDELDAIAADAESTQFEDPETDFAAIESELGGDLNTNEEPAPEPITPEPTSSTTESSDTNSSTTSDDVVTE